MGCVLGKHLELKELRLTGAEGISGMKKLKLKTNYIYMKTLWDLFDVMDFVYIFVNDES